MTMHIARAAYERVARQTWRWLHRADGDAHPADTVRRGTGFPYIPWGLFITRGLSARKRNEPDWLAVQLTLRSSHAGEIPLVDTSQSVDDDRSRSATGLRRRRPKR